MQLNSCNDQVSKEFCYYKICMLSSRSSQKDLWPKNPFIHGIIINIPVNNSETNLKNHDIVMILFDFNSHVFPTIQYASMKIII